MTTEGSSHATATEGNHRSDEVRRLWEYRHYVENAFHQRNSFLLVAESMLLTALAAVFSSGPGWVVVARVLASFGLFLTAVWWYVNARHLANYEDLRAEVEKECPEYRRVRSLRRRMGPSTWTVVAHAVPLSTLVVWAVLLGIVLRRAAG